MSRASTSTVVDFEPTFAAWRREARRLVAAGVRPEAVEWRSAEGGTQLGLGAAGASGPGDPARRSRAAGRRARVPAAFVGLAETVACHRDPDRWELLYRLLWRLAAGERHLLAVTVDPDVDRARRMAKAVRRDCHKTKAFVRFRRIEGREDELYAAWHRPDHRILERVAPFFRERFNDQRWVIATPDRSAAWDLERLTFGPGVAEPPSRGGDGVEGLWKSYYASIFNPARLKVRAMKAELPVRHWATLPEAALIPGLVRQAPVATEAMLEPSAYPPAAGLVPEPPTLPAIAAALPVCHACPLYESASAAVAGEGPAGAELALVGEQPGGREDLEGRPFVGPAGQLLDAALAAAGLDREVLYLTNAVKHFKFERRGKWRIHKTASTTEVTACHPWLEAEMAVVTPRLVVCLGSTAARAVIGPGVRVTRQRGSVLTSRLGPPAMPTTHPAAVLRIPDPPSRERAFRRLVADLAAAAAWVASDGVTDTEA